MNQQEIPMPRLDEMLEAMVSRVEKTPLRLGHAAEWPDDIKAVLLLDLIMTLKRHAGPMFSEQLVKEILKCIRPMIGEKLPPLRAAETVMKAFHADMRDLKG